ncbi:MAG: transglutaminase family protein [Verrucomicrobiota bacterium]
MRLHVHHRTTYYYSAPVTDSVNDLRLSPRDTLYQTTDSSFISVLPACRLTHYEDLNMNWVHHFEIPQPHTKLTIDSRTTVTTKNKVDYENLPFGFHHGQLKKCRDLEECYPFLQDSTFIERTPELWRQALDIQGFSDDVFQTSYSIMEHVFENYQYQSGATSVSTHALEVVESKTGVCQDFAHVMAALCRSIGIPCRYVSGYFYDPSRDHSMRGAEASHAWAEVYIDGPGWIGLDPTNNKVVDETYVIVARGRDYLDVAPVTGVFSGAGRSAMEVSVNVTRLD